jgi:hypothetical protein
VKHSTDRFPKASPENTVTLGANAEVRLVSMFFGDPLAPSPHYVTFTPEQAEEIGAALQKYADIARGRKL